jgi:DNA primase
MITRRTVELVIDTARIEEVVGDYVVLKKKGANLSGLCPFHNEKTPSFSVSPVKGIYKCFGCGASGNAVGFVMEHDKLTFPEAIKHLAKRYHIEVEETEQNKEVVAELMEKESLMLVNTFAGQYLEEQLWESESGKAIAHSYFKERCFTDETIRKFNLGYSPDAWSAFTDAAYKAGYKLEYLVKTGLSIEKEGKYFDRFRGRVMFPIHNVSGKIIAFGGRILGNDKKTAKYVNSPESEVYYKSKALYGIHLARKSIITEDVCFLVEGYTDVISLHQAGVENVVASSGTSLTEDQIRVINRYTKNITILYDGDAAGIKASFRGIDMILAQGMNVKVLLFPDGDDPDSFARKNNPLFIKEYLQNEAQDFIDFKSKVLQEETGDDPIKKAGMIRELVESIAIIPDPIIRSVYAKACAKKIETEESVLLNEISKIIQSKKKKENFKTNEHPEEMEENNFHENIVKPKEIVNFSKVEQQEKTLVRLLLQYANELINIKVPNENGVVETITLRVGDLIMSELFSDEVDFKFNGLNKIVQLFNIEEGENYPCESDILRNDDQEIVNTAITLISYKHELSLNWQDKHKINIPGEIDNLKKAVYSALYSFRIRRVEEMEQELNAELNKSSETDATMEILTRLKALLDVKQELGKELQYVVLK